MVEKGIEFGLDDKMIVRVLIRKGIVFVKMVKCFKDYEFVIEVYWRVFKVYCINVEVFNKLKEVERVKWVWEWREFIDFKIGDEECEKGELVILCCVWEKRIIKIDKECFFDIGDEFFEKKKYVDVIK